MDIGDRVKVINRKSIFCGDKGEIISGDCDSGFMVFISYYPSRLFEDEMVYFDEHELELVP